MVYTMLYYGVHYAVHYGVYYAVHYGVRYAVVIVLCQDVLHLTLQLSQIKAKLVQQGKSSPSKRMKSTSRLSTTEPPSSRLEQVLLYRCQSLLCV